MIIFESIQQLQNHLNSIRADKKILGFVPTMGALHTGHIALVKKALSECDYVVCSIFVNPTQFNDPEDLKKYPRTLPADCHLLEQAGCHVVFAPSASEMYTEQELQHKLDQLEDETWKGGRKVDFGRLDKVMEGAQRPGHFNGVAQVVSKLFRIVAPQKAYFGLKDFQQLAIIRSMSSQLGFPVSIVACPIEREPDGLAMSSRNVRLDEPARKLAPMLYKGLQLILSADPGESLAGLLTKVKAFYAAYPEIELEYIEIADAQTLEPVTAFHAGQNLVACLAAKIGGVRLIDNVLLSR